MMHAAASQPASKQPFGLAAVGYLGIAYRHFRSGQRAAGSGQWAVEGRTAWARLGPFRFHCIAKAAFDWSQDALRSGNSTAAVHLRC